ncbi:NAD(P)-dependent oxidoreductase [Sphingomonas ginsenosidivorax]|uniref:NAD(P)-dependent oxidoreductase n=1 Tax=Sphingomonas ginsenosidivorax TaxID=862135 RepID=A0A5C6UGX4_9SPHN|nr:NAD(P)-dependent oxidoreductase [Sphingomonas ginsenosidivorax]TXC72013.1 NAD(P)-dependent oxidoreductase [Sphingomonas ginsenosidivorax]
MSRRALITGVTGYIGGELAKRLLADGWQVDAIVRPQSDVAALPFGTTVKLHTVDSRRDLTSAVAFAKPDIVFHLASLYLADHKSDQIPALVESNILFPALLAEAMAANGVRHLINTGTAWQHFKGEEYLPVNLYAATKQAAEDLLLYYADAHNLSVVTLRLFDTYGMGDKRRKLIQILIDAVRSGLPLDMSPGEQVVDMTHVDDVIDAFLIAADTVSRIDPGTHEAFFVSGERYQVKSLVNLVAGVSKRTLQVNFGGRPYRQREVMTPIASDGRVLPGWQARRTLVDEIERQLHL